MEKLFPTVVFDATSLTVREKGMLGAFIQISELAMLSPLQVANRGNEVSADARRPIVECVAALMRHHFPDVDFWVELVRAPPERPARE